MKEKNNNPIKEHEGDVISKIITHTLGDEESYYSDDNTNYHNNLYYDDYYKKRKFLLFFPVFMFIMFLIGMLSNSGIIGGFEEKREFNDSAVAGFTCDSGIVIPTLYKYTRYNKCVTSIETLNDNRFRKSDTIESTYTVPISDMNITLYIDGLTKEGFYHVGEYEGDKVYLKEETRQYERVPAGTTNKYYDVYAFVILSKERIIYGEGNGDYEAFLDN